MNLFGKNVDTIKKNAILGAWAACGGNTFATKSIFVKDYIAT